jgi:hypothetical protein
VKGKFNCATTHRGIVDMQIVEWPANSVARLERSGGVVDALDFSNKIINVVDFRRIGVLLLVQSVQSVINVSNPQQI